MKIPTPLTAGKSMLGAALAGLSMVSTDAEAAVYVESTDFGNTHGTATDLGSTFGNFLNANEVMGSLMVSGGGDNYDYIQLNVAPSTLANISFSASASTMNSFFGLLAYDSTGVKLSEAYLYLMPDIGTTYQESLPAFMTPANGIIVLGTPGETGPAATINYSISSVPEPTSAIFGVAGLAAAALRRRRNEQ